jgi:protein-glucosylgalactosylhydroxylysine glucosidase
MSNCLVSTYDNNWTITVTNSNASLTELQTAPGAFLGNGKIGLITAFDTIGTQKSTIGVNFDFNENGLYTNNVMNAFNFTAIKVFDNKKGPETTASYEFTNQSLDMFSGIATTNFTVTDASNSNIVDISYDLYPVRHLPYCCVQTIRFTPQQSMSNLEIYHELSTEQNIIVDDYNNNVIYNELVNPQLGTYMMTGKGHFRDTQKPIAIASCYIANSWSNLKIIGFNRHAKDPNTCYQKLVFSNLSAGSNYTVNILTTQMTGYDFKLPAEEVKRISINVANKAQTPEQILTLRQNHVNAWYKMWKHNVTIEPKNGITDQETAEFNATKRLLRYGMYNIWSSVREGIRTEVNPSSLTVLDSFGTLFWDGDLWFLPILIFFRPDIAKNVLESRYRILDRALELAAGYGFSGSKYPYVQDVSGYINTPYWDINGPMHIFNTALISINIWNYYRITLDKEWLQNKGYTMMKNNADFFISRVDVDEDGGLHFNKVNSFHDKVSNDNALTNYLIKTALNYTIQASYELNMVANDEWGRVYYNINMPFFDDNPNGIVMMDADAQQSDTYKFLEMLIPLVSCYWDMYFNTCCSSTRDWTNLETNLNFYKDKISQEYENNPLNNLMLAWMNAELTNHRSSYPVSFYNALLKTLDENVVGLWGNLNMDNKDNAFNDNSLSSMFILMLLTTVSTVRLTGIVTETRFYTEAMGFKVDNTSSMPRTWKNIKITGIGSGRDTYNITNQVYYP